MSHLGWAALPGLRTLKYLWQGPKDAKFMEGGYLKYAMSMLPHQGFGGDIRQGLEYPSRLIHHGRPKLLN